MAKRGEAAEDEEMTRKEVKVRASWRGGNRRAETLDKGGFLLVNVCDERKLRKSRIKEFRTKEGRRL